MTKLLPDDCGRVHCDPVAPEEVAERRNRPSDARAPKGGAGEVSQLPRGLREVTIELHSIDAPLRRCAAPTRSLSANRMGIVLGHFVCPGTICRVRLVGLNDKFIEQSGQVANCSYIAGSGHQHEVEVRFDAPLDMGIFDALIPQQVPFAAGPGREAGADSQPAPDAPGGMQVMAPWITGAPVKDVRGASLRRMWMVLFIPSIVFVLFLAIFAGAICLIRNS